MSSGVFDITDLLGVGNATKSDFEQSEFWKRTPEWGETPSRQPETYEKIVTDIFARHENLAKKSSIGDAIGEKFTGRLSNRLSQYIQNHEESRNMFIVHFNRERALIYYKNAINGAVCNIQRKRCNRQYPVALSITLTTEDAVNVHEEYRKRGGNSALITPEIYIAPPNKSIFVGSAEKVEEYIENLRRKAELNDLRKNLKYITVENCEKFVENREYLLAIAKILSIVDSYTTILFFALGRGRNRSVEDSFLIARELSKKKLVIETEKVDHPSVFQFIRLHEVSSLEAAKDDTFLHHPTGKPDAVIKTENIILTPNNQKNMKCARLIKKLIEQRECFRRTDRMEKILVITRTEERARFAALGVKVMEPSFRIAVITQSDSIVAVEKTNFKFRGNKTSPSPTDIVFIDWRSIRDINRGIVDAVIFYDVPELEYFLTVFETELRNLISRNVVKLKTHVLFDKVEDIRTVPFFYYLHEKYCQSLPIFFDEIRRAHNAYTEQQLQ